MESIVLLAACGHPIDEAEILNMVNTIVLDESDPRAEAYATTKVVRGLFNKYPDLKFVKAASLDPA